MIAFKTLLEESGLPRHELWPLLEAATGKPREWIIARPESAPEPAAAALLGRWIQSRQRGMPLAYLTGFREFYGRRFWVNPDVLIPRQDTEILIDTVHALMGETDPALSEDSVDPFDSLRLCDLGCGSGCIGISLALEFPGARVTVTDVSERALALARNNAAWLGAEPSMEFLQGSWWAALDAQPGQTFHGICSNPPYIRPNDHHLHEGDLRFEPSLALTGMNSRVRADDQPADPQGLSAIRTLVSGSLPRLEPGGFLLIEHGFDQQDDVVALMSQAGFAMVQGIQDLAGQPRAVLGLKSPE